VNFSRFQAATHILRLNFRLNYFLLKPRQPAYEIKLMLSRVSWALARISC